MTASERLTQLQGQMMELLSRYESETGLSVDSVILQRTGVPIVGSHLSAVKVRVCVPASADHWIANDSGI